MVESRLQRLIREELPACLFRPQAVVPRNIPNAVHPPGVDFRLAGASSTDEVFSGTDSCVGNAAAPKGGLRSVDCCALMYNVLVRCLPLLAGPLAIHFPDGLLLNLLCISSVFTF